MVIIAASEQGGAEKREGLFYCPVWRALTLVRPSPTGLRGL